MDDGLLTPLRVHVLPSPVVLQLQRVQKFSLPMLISHSLVLGIHFKQGLILIIVKMSLLHVPVAHSDEMTSY